MPKLYKRSKDTGIIPNLGITEEKRDSLRKRDWSKRQAHPEPCDNWTTKECEEKKFSGIRLNRLNGDTEIWCVGELRVRRKTQDVGNNPSILATMHEEAFGTVGTILDIELNTKRIFTQREVRRKK